MLSIHLGSSGKLAITAADAPIDVMITLQPMNIVQAAADLNGNCVANIDYHGEVSTRPGAGWSRARR